MTQGPFPVPGERRVQALARTAEPGGWGWLPDVVCKLVGNGMVPRHVMKSGDKSKPSIGLE